MKHALFFLALLGFALGTTPAYSQSPWVIPPNEPRLYRGFAANISIKSPQPNILVGLCSVVQGQGVTTTQAFITVNNGQTWQSQDVAGTIRGPMGVGLVGTYPIDMFMLDGQYAWLLTRDAATASLSLSRTTTGLAGLVTLPNPLPATFTKIHFFSPSIGLALASAPLRIFRTTDGGSTWSILANVTATGNPISSPFITPPGIANTVCVFTDNTMLRTTDAGVSWTYAPVPIGFLGVTFDNPLQGLGYTMATTTGGAQQLYRTADGGLTWAPVTYSGQPLFDSITAVPGQPGTYMSVGYTYDSPARQYTGVSAITRDAGNTWQTLATDDMSFASIAATSPSHVWASTYYSAGSTLSPSPPLLRYMGTALATKNAAGKASSLLAYPNPSSGLVQLAGPLAGKETARVYDAAGRLCQQADIWEAHRTLDLSAQAPGLYVLKLTAPDGTVRTQRLSKLP